jgi:hypothetical protein
MPNLLKAALWYAEHALPVFPLLPRDKNPITKHGFHDASKDPATVRSWWKANPQANIGMPMGKPSGRLLLDLDFRNGGPKDRMEVVERYGAIPETAEVITGAGRHIYFRDPGCPVPRQIAKGIELKSTGGYSVLPPSVHPNGKRYAFDGLTNQETMLHVAEIPDWLPAAIAAPGARSKKAGQAKPEPQEEKWPAGDRNTRLTSLAGRLRRSGLSTEAIAAALLEENQLRCVPPLPDGEVRRIAVSIGRYPAGNGEPSGAGDSAGSAPRSAQIHIDNLEPDVKVLNALAIFGGRIRFESVRRRGQLLIAQLVNGRQAIWHTMIDLTTFSRSQAILAGATGILIPTPAKNKVRSAWEPAAQMLLQLGETDQILSDADLKEEFDQVLRATWVRAGRPEANTDVEFIEFLQSCLSHARDPASDRPPRCCIWVADGYCWIHQPSLLEWLSTPSCKNTRYAWGVAKEALFLLGFEPQRLHRSAEGCSSKVSVWRGPLDLLVDDETEA